MRSYQIDRNPSDYPGAVVVRVRSLMNGIPRGDLATWVCNSVEQARQMIPPGLRRVPRDEHDPRPLVETWL